MHAAQELMKHTLAELRGFMRPGVSVADVDRLTRFPDRGATTVGAQLVSHAPVTQIGIAFPPSWDEGYIVSLTEGDDRTARGGHDLPPDPLDVGRGRGQDRRHLGHRADAPRTAAPPSSPSPEDFVVHESGARAFPTVAPMTSSTL